MKALRITGALVIAIVLTGCFGIGPDPGDPDGGQQPTAPDLSQFDVEQLSTTAEGEMTQIDAPVFIYSSSVGLAQSAFGLLGVIRDWTPDTPQSYTYLGDGPEVTWSEDNGTWCWTIVPDADTTVEICVTPTADTLAVTMTITTPDTVVSIDGTMAADGSNGSLSMSQTPSTNTAEYEWGPSPNGYDWRFEAAFTQEIEGQPSTDRIIVETSSDGTTGEFTAILDEGGNESTLSDSWPSP